MKPKCYNIFVFTLFFGTFHLSGMQIKAYEDRLQQIASFFLLAAQTGNIAVVSRYLHTPEEDGATTREWLLNLVDINGCTPLMLAAQSGSIETLTRLLDTYKTNDSKIEALNKLNNSGENCLMHAVWGKNQDILELLLTCYGDDDEARQSALFQKDRDGDTVLMCAAGCGLHACVKILLDSYGDQLTAIKELKDTNLMGYTALTLAVMNRYKKVVEIILNFCDDYPQELLDLCAIQDSLGWPAYWHAHVNDSRYILTLLNRAYVKADNLLKNELSYNY